MAENPLNPFWYPSADVTGATMRDMFAAVCPDVIPDWFKPSDVPDAPTVVMTPDEWFSEVRAAGGGAPALVTKEDSDVYGQYYNYETKQWNGGDETTVIIPPTTKDKVAAYEIKYADYVTDFNHWHKHYKKEMHFQWRWYYADEMLLKRDGDTLS